MSALSVLLAARTNLEEAQVEHLQRLVGEWQLLADLSFADLLLWVEVDGEFMCVAQCRPTTGPTAHMIDRVGQFRSGERASALRVALDEQRICRESDPDWTDDVPVRHEAIPVRFGNDVIAVLARDANLTSVRGPSQLELAYLQSAADLAVMVADGTFPASGPVVDGEPGPRAGDGLLRLDADARVLYSSPNALSAFRRLGAMGDVLGERFADVLGSAGADPLMAADLLGRIDAAVDGQSVGGIEVEGGGATVSFRTLGLVPHGEHLGALVLLQDVTELRRRDRQIMSKDATIREIHHRVKNNLQTVAALLRLQARRVSGAQARTALEEAMRRVRAIALVHETLSVADEDSVAFDEVVDRLIGILVEVTGAEDRVELRRTGSFGGAQRGAGQPAGAGPGRARAQRGRARFRRGGPGTVEVSAIRDGASLAVSVIDDGAGLPPGFDPARSDRLGLQIVRTLADADLHTNVEWRSRSGPSTGTLVSLRVNVTDGARDPTLTGKSQAPPRRCLQRRRAFTACRRQRVSSSERLRARRRQRTSGLRRAGRGHERCDV